MNKFISNIIMLSLTFTFLLSSCEVNDSPDDSDNISSLGTKILFDVSDSYENYDTAEKPKLYLNLVTEKIYGCINYSIIIDKNVFGNIININIKDVVLNGDICLTALGPAHGRSVFDLGDGKYTLILGDGKFSDIYSVLISDSSVTISGDTTVNTRPNHRVYWRYPENSFVYLCGTTIPDSNICRDFLDTLSSKIDITEFHFPKGGIIPYPVSSSGHYYDAPARYFYYKSEEDFDKINDILKEYQENHFSENDGISISIINWINKRIYSWVLIDPL